MDSDLGSVPDRNNLYFHLSYFWFRVSVSRFELIDSWPVYCACNCVPQRHGWCLFLARRPLWFGVIFLSDNENENKMLALLVQELKQIVNQNRIVCELGSKL